MHSEQPGETQSEQPGGTMSHDRFPRRVYGAGDDPDPRFSLANERTFLAWIRTALALIASGVALEALDLPLLPGLRLAASLILLALGVMVPVLGWLTWASVERAMREGTALPRFRLGLPLGVGVAAAGLIIVLGLLL